MENGEHHEMLIEQTYEDGSQEWVCPVCGRRFILHWPPNYQREVLEEGDVQAIHTGGMGGLKMGASQNVEYQPEVAPDDRNLAGGGHDLEDPYLSPWAHWLDENGM
jgi:hypothetical protein